MSRILTLLDRVSAVVCLLSAWAGLAVMVSIVLLILTEVVLRSFFATSTQITEEYVGYGLGAMIFLGLGHALRSGGLVRVDLVLQRLGPMARRVTEVVLCIVTLHLMAFVMWFFFISVSRNYSRGTISMTKAGTPIWIPEAIMLTGMGIFTFALAIYCLRLLAGGDIVQSGGQEG